MAKSLQGCKPGIVTIISKLIGAAALNNNDSTEIEIEKESLKRTDEKWTLLEQLSALSEVTRDKILEESNTYSKKIHCAQMRSSTFEAQGL